MNQFEYEDLRGKPLKEIFHEDLPDLQERLKLINWGFMSYKGVGTGKPKEKWSVFAKEIIGHLFFEFQNEFTEIYVEGVKTLIANFKKQKNRPVMTEQDMLNAFYTMFIMHPRILIYNEKDIENAVEVSFLKGMNAYKGLEELRQTFIAKLETLIPEDNKLLTRYITWSKTPRKSLAMLQPGVFAEFENMEDRECRAFLLLLFLDETKMANLGAVCFVANRYVKIREE